MSEPKTSWSETIGPGEDALLQRMADELAGLPRGGGVKDRALHPKGHAGLRATLTIDGGLPQFAAHGLFAKPGAHRCYVRFSNGSAKRQHDKAPDLRGLAIKVLGVEGPKELGTATTQDFLLIDNHTLPFRSPTEFISLVKAGANQATLPFKLFGALGFRAFGLIASLAKEVRGNRGSLLDLDYHTLGSIKVGPYAARVHLDPLHHASPHAKPGADRDYLGAELKPRVRAGGIAFALSLQFHTSEAESVEDINHVWGSPKVRVGRLDLLPEDADSTEGRALRSFVETLSFDPWHCLVEHRPLGLTMRARKPAYYASTTSRAATTEPDGTEWGSFGPG